MLLPLASVLALALISQGVIQNFSPYRDASLLQPLTCQQQKTDAAGTEGPPPALRRVIL